VAGGRVALALGWAFGVGDGGASVWAGDVAVGEAGLTWEVAVGVAAGAVVGCDVTSGVAVGAAPVTLNVS
jgi:hypothetical protein